jgi:DNA invertase Pin-like site-specific DNA recombinase
VPCQWGAARPGLLKLLAALTPKPTTYQQHARRPAAPPFQILLLTEPSRLGREQVMSAYTLQVIRSAGVRVYVLDGPGGRARELTLDTAQEKFLSAVAGYTDEVERERVAKRVTDAMRHRAEEGYVTGGACYGYDNVRVDGHVERRINVQQAAVIVRIFKLCAQGHGRRGIAKHLNAEGCTPPRPQQGRPAGWVASSVREALLRTCYKGVITWNASQKRSPSAMGAVAQRPRPRDEWIETPAPQLRIVSDDLWDKARARMAQTNASYLRGTGGRLHGRPTDPTARKHLMVGLIRCGVCNSGMEVKTRPSGHGHLRQRQQHYGCAAHWNRGNHICGNKLLVPMAVADDGILRMIEQQLLTSEFADRRGQCDAADAAHTGGSRGGADADRRAAQGTATAARSSGRRAGGDRWFTDDHAGDRRARGATGNAAAATR